MTKYRILTEAPGEPYEYIVEADDDVAASAMVPTYMKIRSVIPVDELDKDWLINALLYAQGHPVSYGPA